MASDWLVGITFLAKGNLTNELASAGRAAERANLSFQRQQGLIDKNTAATQRYRMAMDAANERALVAQRNAATTQALIAGGVAFGMSKIALFSLSQAGQFQEAMTSVRNSVVATAQQYKELGDLATNVSNVTAQSAVTIAQEMAAASHNGLNNINQLNAAFPSIAKFADVLYLSPEHADTKSTVEQLSSFAHLMGTYSGKPFEDMMNMLAKAKLNSNAPLSQFVTQAGYFAPLARQVGLTNDEIVGQLVAMSQTGLLRGKGGTGLQNELLALIDPSKGQYKAQIEAGLRTSDGKLKFEDEKGHIQFSKMSEYLQKMLADNSKNKADVQALIMDMFGKQGGRFVIATDNAQAAERIHQVNQKMKTQPGLDAQFQSLQNNYNTALNKVKTNIQNVGKDIFGTLLPEVTSGLNHLADGLGAIDNFLRQHPDGAKFIADSFIAATIGVSIVAGRAALRIWEVTAALAALGKSPIPGGVGGPGNVITGGGKKIFFGRGGKLISIGEGVAERAAGTAVAEGAGGALEEAGIAADATGVGLPVGVLLNVAGAALMLAPFVPDIINGVKSAAKTANQQSAKTPGVTATGLNYGYQGGPNGLPGQQDYMKHDAGWFIHQSGNKKAIEIWDKMQAQAQDRARQEKTQAERQGQQFQQHWQQVQRQQAQSNATQAQHLSNISKGIETLITVFQKLGINVHVDQHGNVTVDKLHQSVTKSALTDFRTQGVVQSGPTHPLPGISPYILNTINQ